MHKYIKNNMLNNRCGMLSNEDFKRFLDKEIVITPYTESNLTPSGYNITATEFILSVNKKRLLNIERTSRETYCIIEPNDTVLILTREAIWVSDNIAGSFHSKVKLVSKGFGHISTTLDPSWMGPLLISLNNPTNKKIKFLISYKKNEETKYESFVTLSLFKLISKNTIKHDNPPSRFDILSSIRMDGIINSNNKKLYTELYSAIERIQNFEHIVTNCSLQNNTSEIDSFKKRYENHSMEIQQYIKEATNISEEIYYRNYISKIVMTGFSWALFLFFGFIVWNEPRYSPIFAALFTGYISLLKK